MKINSVEDLYRLVSETEYGWLDTDGNKHYKLEMAKYQEKYILQSPQEIIQNKIGVCWDQVELERYYLNKLDIPCKSYLIYYAGERKDRAHTFLIYEMNGFVYWFEHAWGNYKGLHKYSNYDDIFNKIKKIFIEEELKNDCDLSNVHIYQYDQPKFHIGHYDFLKHCLSGIMVL